MDFPFSLTFRQPFQDFDRHRQQSFFDLNQYLFHGIDIEDVASGFEIFTVVVIDQKAAHQPDCPERAAISRGKIERSSEKAVRDFSDGLRKVGVRPVDHFNQHDVDVVINHDVAILVSDLMIQK